ncbi:peptidase [bacterium]|nr:MAG: peptidase [bacterium]
MRTAMRYTALLLLITLFAVPANAGTIVIVNLDSPGEGFNDNTPAAPVGGNPGTTIGQQRLNLFSHAADIWGALLPSAVTIRIEAKFDPLSCDASGGVLGSAGPIEVYRDFSGAEFSSTWYHVALANKQAGSDLSPSGNDIGATFNSDIDNNDNCLAGTNWYYGFDGNEGGDIELLPVLLHEFGHGLGFSTLIGSNGSEFFGFSDLYETFLLDNSNGLHWDDMTQSQRAASAINTGNVVWDGFASTFASRFFLGGLPTMYVNSGTGLPATMLLGTAGFGPQLDETGVTGELVLVDDGSGVITDGCSALINGGAVSGKIALIDRGACAFTTKAQNAEAAGAIAVVIANNVAGGAIALGGTDPGLTIPTVSVSLADGILLKAALGSGTVNLTLALDPSELAGADSSGRVKIYTPNPYQGGSSVSHWDTSATPSLLMEPFISGNLSDGVDLTLYHFEDLGWLDARLTSSPGNQSTRTALSQNSPNPFNPITKIDFSLRKAGPVSLDIYDVKGRRVRELLSQDFQPGEHHVIWNGRDDAGQPVASGVYMYRLSTADQTLSKQMVLLK